MLACNVQKCPMLSLVRSSPNQLFITVMRVRLGRHLVGWIAALSQVTASVAEIVPRIRQQLADLLKSATSRRLSVVAARCGQTLACGQTSLRPSVSLFGGRHLVTAGDDGPPLREDWRPIA